MKLKNIELSQFKHFTSLRIRNLPETARLIVLVGPNGCGKSSFIEAIHTWCRWKTNRQYWDNDYHTKRGSGSRGPHSIDQFVQIISHDEGPEDRNKMVYVRSAYRNETEFQTTQLSQIPERSSEIRISRLIDNDPAVSRNYQRMVSNFVEDFFEVDEDLTVGQFKKTILGDVKLAFEKLFPEIQLDSFSNPLKEGTFKFTKGVSQGYLYKNLSGGEKAAFDLILDLVIAIRTFDDTVFCVDEPELHMNARLQSQLLKVLYDVIPENSQLIVTTHSIGMIRQARDIEKSNPGFVVFLDFSDLDFDVPQVIEPTAPGREFWKKAYGVALDDLAELVAPERIVICEGEPRTETKKAIRNHSYDAHCYGQIFKDEFPETQFISAGNNNAVKSDVLIAAIGEISSKIDVIRVIDKDNYHQVERMDLIKKGVRVLSERNLETYLYDDEVLEALAVSEGKSDSIEELLSKKRKIIEEIDNPKDASGQIYNLCTDILDLKDHGNDHKAFEKYTLARLIRKGMKVYARLKDDIFGEG